MSQVTSFSGISDLRALPTPSCELGENPFWDAKRELVYWTDIPRGRIYSWSPETQKVETLYEDDVVGGFTLQSDGRLLLFRTQDAVALCPDSKEVTPLLTFDIPDNGRFNDVIADPLGRVFCGRLTPDPTAGGVYLLHQDGRLDPLWKGTGCSNGFAFSKDLQTLYWTCSTTRTIFRFTYDVNSGSTTNREVFLKVETKEVPDGLTMDDDGLLFSARWDGFGISVLNTKAEEIGRIALPPARVTSAIAGGRNLDQLFITTAGGDPDTDQPEGKLYTGKLSRPGRAEHLSRILVVK